MDTTVTTPNTATTGTQVLIVCTMVPLPIIGHRRVYFVVVHHTHGKPMNSFSHGNHG